MNVIEVKGLSFDYPGTEVLRDISFEVESGSFWAIAGPNGVGKTTLLNLLCGVLGSKGGSIKIDGSNIESYSVRELAQKIAVVRQEFVPVFDFTVEETVLMARTPYLPAFGFEREADRTIAADALEMTDTAQFASRPLSELSGGERQRSFIARALAQDTGILLLDEPTSFLDLRHQVQIYDLLKSAQLEKGKTVITVTHDINLAAQYVDFVLLLSSECGYQSGRTKDVFLPEQIEKVFGVKTFTVCLGREKFFIPLGKFAKISTELNGPKPGGRHNGHGESLL